MQHCRNSCENSVQEDFSLEEEEEEDIDEPGYDFEDAANDDELTTSPLETDLAPPTPVL